MPYPPGPLETLLRPGQAADGSHRPEFFTLPQDEAALRALLEHKPGLRITDRIHAQLGELVKALHPGTKFTPAVLEEAITAHLAGKPPAHHGTWVHYPWNDRLVHLLGAEEFQVVRTDRNRNKITREEQAVLATKKVGVIGLSVGQSVSLAMALERSFGEIRLADFDTLDLSNLNRLRSGVHNLGLNKAVITAREIAEVDPYLKVTCFTEGLTKDNMDAFFTAGGQLDILVEECDSVDIKILARQKAKALGIPVVMDMSDRGCLDVERFDLEPDRPLMHGWIDHLDLSAAGRAMTSEEKLPYMLPISGVETLSPRMKASMIEMEHTVSTWPQLATSVVLGGALAGDAVRRIALGQFSASGRWFVDLEEIVADAGVGSPEEPEPGPAPFHVTETRMRKIQADLGPASPTAIDPGEDRIERLVEAGSKAPSAGNNQPWLFLWNGQQLLLFHDIGRSGSVWDPDHLMAQIGLGACLENVVLEAHAMGLEVTVRHAPVPSEPMVIAAIEFHREATRNNEAHDADDLHGMIALRCTNRKVAAHQPLHPGVISYLQEKASTVQGCSLRFLERAEELDQVARLCGIADRIRLVNPHGHKEFFGHEIRWKPETEQGSQDGLDVATLELSEVHLAGLRVASDPQAMGLIDSWNAGKGLEQMSGYGIRTASAVMLLSISGDGTLDRLQGGRALARTWMAANAKALAVHPISAPIFVTHLLGFPDGVLRDHERAELEVLRQAFHALWDLGKDRPLFMVRLSHAGAPSMRALRRPVSELLLKRTGNKATTDTHWP